MASEQQLIVLDLDLARRNFGGDETLIRDIGQIFIEDVPALTQQLVHLRTRLFRDAVQETLLAEAQRLAHSLKGLAGTFGAEPLGSLLGEIERQPKVLAAEDGDERLRTLAEVAQHTVDELIKCLKAI